MVMPGFGRATTKDWVWPAALVPLIYGITGTQSGRNVWVESRPPNALKMTHSDPKTFRADLSREVRLRSEHSGHVRWWEPSCGPGTGQLLDPVTTFPAGAQEGG